MTPTLRDELPPFRDRRDAGRRLGAYLTDLASGERTPLVMGLARGGVPVAYEVAAALDAPLDVALVRKLGAPTEPEYAIGALGERGVLILDKAAVRATGTSRDQLAHLVNREALELSRRRAVYFSHGEHIPIAGRPVVLVDDGIATGLTAIVAGRVLREQGAGAVTLAVPVAPLGAQARVRKEFDRFVALAVPSDFQSVGQYYERFRPTSDDEVVDLVARAHARERITQPVVEVM